MNWLIPFVWGWFAITTQYGREQRTNRLLENRAARLYTLNPNNDVVEVPRQPVPQPVLRVRGIAEPDLGDEQQLGSFYNYARLGTWSYLAKTIVLAYQTVQILPTDAARRDAALRSITENWNRFGWMNIKYEGSDCLSRGGRALFFAFLLQASTGWSAFLISYKTPVAGIGCRGFVFLLYSTFSLIACVLLISASYVSDWRSFRRIEIGPGNWATILLGIIETALRYTGKFIACLNAVILITSCFLQFTGVYQNCYCGSNRISRGAGAYVNFPNTQEQGEIAVVSWRLGFAITIVPCILYVIYFQISKNDLPPNRR